jgi:hypothetical protein
MQWWTILFFHKIVKSAGHLNFLLMRYKDVPPVLRNWWLLYSAVRFFQETHFKSLKITFVSSLEEAKFDWQFHKKIKMWRLKTFQKFFSLFHSDTVSINAADISRLTTLLSVNGPKNGPMLFD